MQGKKSFFVKRILYSCVCHFFVVPLHTDCFLSERSNPAAVFERMKKATKKHLRFVDAFFVAFFILSNTAVGLPVANKKQSVCKGTTKK